MIKIGALSYANLIKALMAGELTVRELAEETGLHYLTVCYYTRALHKVGAVHIVRWDEDACGRRTAKVFQLGAGKDAKRVKQTDAQRQASLRARKYAAKQLAVLAGKGRWVQVANGRLKYEEVV